MKRYLVTVNDVDVEATNGYGWTPELDAFDAQVTQNLKNHFGLPCSFRQVANNDADAASLVKRKFEEYLGHTHEILKMDVEVRQLVSHV